MANIRRAPILVHIFKLVDGTTITCPKDKAVRTLDRRGSWEEPRVVWEIQDGLVWRRVWPEEIVSWEMAQR